MSANGSDDRRIGDLLLRWEDLREGGLDASAEELCAECPELVGELSRRIAGLKRMDEWLSVGDSSGSLPSTEPVIDHGRGVGLRESAACQERYRDLRFHARGGLGEVFMALGTDLNREVALKFLKPDRAGDLKSRRRFLHEAEVTGRLEHPGVVPVYGLGLDDDGAPCYAMRFVRGETLHDAIAAFHEADRPARDPSERAMAFRGLLRRFVSVCNTIAYAHSRGILHRDVKPRNVMLGKYDETLVIDWGLAKPFERDDPSKAAGEGTLRPVTWDTDPAPPTLGGVGTPQFMSPEQAEGRSPDVGPAGDVYSLGMTLYVLLTGRTAFPGPNVAAVLDKVKRGDFAPPRQLKPEAPRALEAICLKAASADPALRYATALDLAADVERWLADEPVSAWREPFGRRARRWARRHRTLVTTASATALVGLLALGVAYRREAKHAAELAGANLALTRANADAGRWLNRAMGSIEDYYTGFTEEALRGGQLPRALRDHLLEKPLRFYEGLTKELSSKADPEERERALLARGLNNLGRIFFILGRLTEARTADEGAVVALETLAARRPDVPEYEHRLAMGYNNLGMVLGTEGRREEAAEVFRKAIAMGKALAARHPDDPDDWRVLGMSHNSLAVVLNAAGRPAEAAEAYRAAVEEFETLATRHPDVPEYRNRLALCQTNLGELLVDAGKLEEAARAFRGVIELGEALIAKAPDVPEYRNSLAKGHGSLGRVLATTGRLEEADGAYRKAIAILEPLVALQPDVPEHRNRLGGCYGNIANGLRAAGRLGEAAEANRKAVATFEALATRHRDAPEYQVRQALSYTNLGIVLTASGQAADGAEAQRKAIAIGEELVGRHPESPEYRHELARSQNSLGVSLITVGRPAEAAVAYRKAIAIGEGLVAGNPQRPDYRSTLGSALGNFGFALEALAQHEEVASSCRKAIGHQRQALDRVPRATQYRQFLSDHYQLLSRSLRTLGRPAEAAEATRERVELWPGNPTELYNAACEFALCIPEIDRGRAETKESGRADRRRYGDRAMEMLRLAVAAGFRDSTHMSKDTDLDPLRPRGDFQDLMRDLYFPSDPFRR